MSKIDIIDYCGDCSHRYYEGLSTDAWLEDDFDLYCGLTNFKTYENNPIPEWCPLKDANLEERSK